MESASVCIVQARSLIHTYTHGFEAIISWSVMCSWGDSIWAIWGMVMDVGQWIQIAIGSFALHQGREILHGMSAGSKSWILRGLLQVALMQQGSRCQDHPKSVAGNTFYRIVRLMGHLFNSTRETYCIHCALPGFDFTGLAQRMDPNAA